MDIYGVIGYPIKHSLSPYMQNAAFKKLGIDAEYMPFEIKPEGLEDFILNREDVLGFNVTVPHKIKALEIVKSSKRFRSVNESYIELSGAINTVKRDGAHLLCANTDVLGFMQSLKEDLKFDFSERKIVLIGCGGAGRAIIAGLTSGYEGKKPCGKLYVYDKSAMAIESAKHFYSGKRCLNALEFIDETGFKKAVKDSELLINASPVGMKSGDDAVIDKKILHDRLRVYDVIYNRETELISAAKSLGLKCSGGLGMLLYQGSHAFELWTGKKAPVEIMRTELKKALKI